MAKIYVCKGCNMECTREITHACDQTCRYCMACPPRAFCEFRFPCAECNRHYRSHTLYDNHKQRKLYRKYLCELK